MKRFVNSWLLVLAGLFVITGCASGPQAKFTPIQKLNAPEWVIKGSGAFGGERGRVIYGVASASNIQNMSLLRSAADNRARNEVAKVLEVYTKSLMKDYMASTSVEQAREEMQDVEQAVKTVASATLSGVEIVEHWQNPDTAELYSLARLDLNAMKDNLEKAKELNARAKEYVRKNADRLHDELEKEVEKVKEAEK